MPRVIDELTPEEVEAVKRIDEEYRPLLDAAMAKFQAAFDAYSKASAAAKAEKRPLTVEEAALGDAMSAAGDEQTALNDKWLDARAQVTRKAETRLFENYRGNVDAILSMIKEEVPRHIAVTSIFAGDEPTEKERRAADRQAAKARKEIEAGIAFNREQLKSRPDDEELIKATNGLVELLDSGAYKLTNPYDMAFSDDALRTSIYDSFANYLEFLKRAAPDAYKEAIHYIDDCIENKRGMYDTVAKKAKATQPPELSVTTITPKEHLSTVDKLSGKAFDVENDVLYTKKLIAVGVERRGSKKEINTLLSMSFDELEKAGVIIDAKKLTPFDREVHDAITTLFVEGGNDVMSVEMIYRTMIGKPKARLAPKQAEAITQSITKMMHTLITIDASQEAKAYGFDNLKYKGNLLYAEMAIASINNNVIEALHVIKEPVLYTYANRTNRIGRVDMKLLDSPINKNEETIILQGYLYRRILAMQHGQNKSIVYDTVYKQLSIDAPSAAALRKKKADVRSKIKTLLDYWKKEKFIAGYVENKRGQEMYSVTIRLKNE